MSPGIQCPWISRRESGRCSWTRSEAVFTQWGTSRAHPRFRSSTEHRPDPAVLRICVGSRLLSSCNSLQLGSFDSDVDRNYHKGYPRLTPRLQQVSAEHQTEETRPLRHQLHPTASISHSRHGICIESRASASNSTHDAYTTGSKNAGRSEVSQTLLCLEHVTWLLGVFLGWGQMRRLRT